MRIYTCILLSTLLITGSNRYHSASVNIALSPSSEAQAVVATQSSPEFDPHTLPERGSGR